MALRLVKSAAMFCTATATVLSLFTAQIGGAQAQANPELGDESDVGAGTGAGLGASTGASWSTGTPAQTTGTVSTTSTTPTTSTAYREEPSAPSYSGSSDHSAMVGNFGIGFFGVTGVPIAIGVAPGDLIPVPVTDAEYSEYVDAPTIGVRYWMSDVLGIEAALGVGIYSDSLESEPAGGGANVVYDVSATAFALHGGLPLALAHSGHFVFEIVPDLNFGFSTGTVYGPTQAQDVDVGGLLLQLGARAGAEIHFGFIDIPQLALQGSIGLHLTYESRSADNIPGGDSVSQSGLSIATSWREDPWDLFTGSVAAIYYFP